ncbi:zinc-dependent alcohol dehydrogenase [Streptomyces inhibens]|uniref:zinc-dependent alcohol dehydrogenase n=1 Tax=Streptomyces inhibens TaxID=2293571 RepID=UPI001EE6F7D9|nr:alcohol dehydrogenase catalytic domain-containing protein [Streptomyces inhibens]UKY54176.1 alcohol dehydrogenase catalytic domain-containing protein [Streptomyces inhibens]
MVCTAPDTIEIHTEAVPTPEPGEALVKLHVSGVCGSDKAGAHGEHAFFKPPYYPGHEVVGEVVQTGEGVDNVSVGDRVTAEPTLVCGHCKPCTTERENLCENLQFFGCGYREGGMADVFTIPATRLHVVPEDFTDHQAALIEPLATPVHAVRLAGDLRDKAVAVLGAGTIGLLVMAAARHQGARKIVMTDTLAGKRELALRLGADAVVDATRTDLAQAVRTELGESADVVFDCVSIQPTVESAIQMVLKGGTVVVVGGARRPITIELPVVQEYQVRIQGATTYRAEDFRDAIDIIASGEIDAADFITATFPLTRAAEAFEAIGSGAEVKILVVAEEDGGAVTGHRQHGGRS